MVIATRDRPRLLTDALASVARQSAPPLEVRIADDGERPLDPGSLAPASSRVAGGDALRWQPGAPGAAPLEIAIVRSGARGAAAARNLASRDARGDVLAFLDDDDRWSSDHLAGLAAAFADPGLGVAYRDFAVLREREERGERRELERRVIAREWDAALMRTDNFIAPSALAVRRSLFERLGGFDEGFRFSEDWDFLLRAAAQSMPKRVPGVTAEVRLRESGNASTDRGEGRIACLEKLAARHALPALELKTFWEVAEAVAAAERA